MIGSQCFMSCFQIKHIFLCLICRLKSSRQTEPLRILQVGVRAKGFCSFLLAAEEKEPKKTVTPKAPYIGGCSFKIGKTTILTSSKLLTLNRLKASLSSVFANPQF